MTQALGYHRCITPATPDDQAARPARAPAQATAPEAGDRGLRRALVGLQLLLALLVVRRVLYHIAYLRDDPFAVMTILDGRAFEASARDIIYNPPFGTQALQLDGLYAYVMALPMSVLPWLAFAMLFQLLLAGAALALFHRAATSAFGKLEGSLGTALLLAYPALAFLENKWSAHWLRAAASMLVLWAFARAMQRATAGRVALFGATCAIAMLSSPWAALALPPSALAVRELARARDRPLAPLLAAFGAGLLLSLAPAALRNQQVLDSPELFARHAITLPLFIGNNPHAEARWNDAGGVIDRAFTGGREAVSNGLDLEGTPAALQDAAIDRELYGRTLAFVAGDPLALLERTARKAWHALGDDEPSIQYDVAGEREILGAGHDLGVPFGVIAALGFLGIAALRRAAAAPSERARLRGFAWLLTGQLLGPLALLLLGYVSTEHRVPLAVALCFAAGPALAALVRAARQQAFAPRRAELALAAVVAAQALVSRGATAEAGAWHYFHLADVQERLGDIGSAIETYDVAIERDPEQPLFLLSQVRLLRMIFAVEPADQVLSDLEGLPGLSEDMRKHAATERRMLENLKRWKTQAAWRPPLRPSTLLLELQLPPVPLLAVEPVPTAPIAKPIPASALGAHFPSQ